MAEIHRKRERKFTVHLLDEELAILDAKADEAEQTKSEYIRNMILFGAAHKKTNFTKDETEKLRYEINRIGNNINQIAYAMNQSEEFDEQKFISLQDSYIKLLGLFDKFIQE